MANRPLSLDRNVFSIADLESLGAKKLPKMYRGRQNLNHTTISKADHYKTTTMKVL